RGGCLQGAGPRDGHDGRLYGFGRSPDQRRGGPPMRQGVRRRPCHRQCRFRAERLRRPTVVPGSRRQRHRARRRQRGSDVRPTGGGGTATSHVVLATPRRGPQTIAFPGLADQAFGAAPVGVTATATSGLAVTFAASGACSVADGSVALLRAGACAITASQSGDATYLPADDVSQTFTIRRATQAITFALLVDQIFGNPPTVVA